MYIGNTPAENYASFLTETFTVSATASYTLSHAVANENDIRLVINGVVQQPGSGKAYTASGTTLTLTSATVSGDVMYAVYLGRALQTVNPPNASVGNSQTAPTIITGQTALDATPADTDELLISDAGTLKRVDYSYLKSANTPMVSAYKSASQTVSDNTQTKIQYNTEVFDTDSAYDNSTNYRFTVPSGKAGKYLINASCYMNGNNNDEVMLELSIYKNGTQVERDERYGNYSTGQGSGGVHKIIRIIDLSASDYIEIFGRLNVNSGTASFYGDSATNQRYSVLNIAKMIG